MTAFVDLRVLGDKIICPRCQAPTHPLEIVNTPALAWTCLRCVEDVKADTEAAG